MIRFCFFSNYLTHHQLPFCLEMVKLTGGGFVFVETEALPQERKELGYKSLGEQYDFVLNATKGVELEKQAMEIAKSADVMIFGSAPEKYLRARMKENKLTFRYSERLFKRGEHDVLRQVKHTARNLPYRNKRLYYLFSSAYAAKDYSRCFVRRDKMFKWGYFPETKRYDNIDEMMAAKRPHSILWAGRLIDWKHPDVPIKLAKRLKEDGVAFDLNIIGNGVMETELREMIAKEQLDSCVHMLGSMSPDRVREHMERSEIYLFTSDFNEGWGAVLNESMNSACAVVASHAIGAVPFLLEDEKNGCIYTYRKDSLDEMYSKLKALLNSSELCRDYGVRAYETIKDEWSAGVAAKRLCALSNFIESGRDLKIYEQGPCSVAEILNQY